MREKDSYSSLLLSSLAFGWHVGDALIHRNTKSRAHKAFMGIGIGWSALWLAKNLVDLTKRQYVETRYVPPVV